LSILPGYGKRYKMTDTALHLANYFFYIFHTVLIIFNLFGWIYARTRKLNLISLLATFGSWGILGLWKGWGYCFLTDWHCRVLTALGKSGMPSSYIAFLLEKATGWSPNSVLLNWLVLGLAVLALSCSLWVNLRNHKQ
jgi:hypothetical protein